MSFIGEYYIPSWISFIIKSFRDKSYNTNLKNTENTLKFTDINWAGKYVSNPPPPKALLQRPPLGDLETGGAVLILYVLIINPY